MSRRAAAERDYGVRIGAGRQGAAIGALPAAYHVASDAGVDMPGYASRDKMGRFPCPVSCTTPCQVWPSPALSPSRATAASAQGINPALKELAAAANKEGSLTLSWSGSTFAGIQGAARYQAAINKMFGTNIRVNFLPGAGHGAHRQPARDRVHRQPARACRPAARRVAAAHAAGQDRFLRARRLEAVSARTASPTR